MHPYVKAARVAAQHGWTLPMTQQCELLLPLQYYIVAYAYTLQSVD